jgi:hypothetical protein
VNSSGTVKAKKQCCHHPAWSYRSTFGTILCPACLIVLGRHPIQPSIHPLGRVTEALSNIVCPAVTMSWTRPPARRKCRCHAHRSEDRKDLSQQHARGCAGPVACTCLCWTCHNTNAGCCSCSPLFAHSMLSTKEGPRDTLPATAARCIPLLSTATTVGVITPFTTKSAAVLRSCGGCQRPRKWPGLGGCIHGEQRGGEHGDWPMQRGCMHA